MVRELFVLLYLLVVKVTFTICKLWPLRNKVTVIETIGGHSPFVYRALRAADENIEIAILKSGKARQFRTVDGRLMSKSEPGFTLVPFESGRPLAFIRCLYHMATAKAVVIDNYIGMLAGIHFKPGVECIQLWHAVGGFKRTGLGDNTTYYRSARAKQRFQKVYDQFHKLVIGSEALAKIHEDAFGLPMSRMLRTGIPRTDLFYDEFLREAIVDKLRQENPLLQTKKVLLYAPTYRDGEFTDENLQMDFARLQAELGEDYVVLLRLHPAVRSRVNYGTLYPSFVFDYSAYPNMNELLLVADCLITDYSSVICEYALLSRPMIFYLYDLDEYLQKRGLWDGYESLVPGPVVYTMTELVDTIREWEFHLDKVSEFGQLWNTYSTGNASQNLARYLTELIFSSARTKSQYQRGNQHEIDDLSHHRTDS